jgi:hypothetical protein
MLIEPSKIIVIFEIFIEGREFNELQDKLCKRRFLDQKLCGFLDYMTN